MRNIAVLAIAFAGCLQAADPQLLNLVMPDATIFAGVNVEKAKATPFGQFVLQQFATGGDLGQFVSATGFDPRRDVTEVLVATKAGQKNGLVLAKGNFNPSQIEAAIEKDGHHVSQTYNGARLIVASDAKDTGAVAFLSSGIAVAGDLSTVKGAIDRSTTTNALDPATASKIASLIASDAWTVALTPLSGQTFSDGANNPIANALKSVQQATGSVTFSSPVQISVEAVAGTDQDATSLSDVIRFVASMIGQNMIGQNMMGQDKSAAGLGSILQSLNITTDHNTVKMSLSIPEDQLEKAVQGAEDSKKAAKRAPGAHV